MRKSIIVSFLGVLISLSFESSVLAFESLSYLSELTQIGIAFMTNLAVHETGHAVVADYVGANGITLDFFTNKNGKFFLGLSKVDRIDKDSRLPYSLGGEIAANLTFEYALKEYRRMPTLYNKSLMFFSGTDFLWYSFYAFYLSEGHPFYDPIAITNETGLSQDILFSVVLLQTILNTYRVYSGQDLIIPYFTFDRQSALFNLRLNF